MESKYNYTQGLEVCECGELLQSRSFESKPCTTTSMLDAFL